MINHEVLISRYGHTHTHTQNRCSPISSPAVLGLAEREAMHVHIYIETATQYIT